MPTYIIEHLEQKLWEWCRIEYAHISEIVGREHCWFTSVSSAKLASLGKVFPKSVTTLLLTKVCVLDPEAPVLLTPQDAQGFDYFIFGGILGNDPPEKRTKKELTLRFPYPVECRNIGPKQMSTDNAVAVVKEIFSGKKFAALSFQDGIEIDLKEGESIQFPYRYLLVNGRPLVSKELREYLRKTKGL